MIEIEYGPNFTREKQYSAIRDVIVALIVGALGALALIAFLAGLP